jgi:imidazole glycerol-phosphate synthase subunit HisF
MIRIISRLDIKGPNLVKGIHLEGLRVLGKPEDFARCYFENGIDELFYMDAVASLYERNSLLEFVARTSREVFIPLCVGGGLRTVDDIRNVLRAGADKAAINTAAIRRPQLISEAAQAFGSSTVVVAIEAIKQPGGRYECFTDCGREATGRDAVEWAKEAERLGAGEIALTSVDREGTGKGFDLDLTRQVAWAVSIPVIAHGGAGKASDVADVAEQGLADAVCLASLLHYTYLEQCAAGREQRGDRSFETEGNVEFLRRGASFGKIGRATIEQIKQEVAGRGFDCRTHASPAVVI